MPERQTAIALARDNRPAAALERDSRVWLLAARDNHLEVQVVMCSLPWLRAAWRLLWEETVAAVNLNRSATNVKWYYAGAATLFYCYCVSLMPKGPGIYTWLTSDIHIFQEKCKKGPGQGWLGCHEAYI